VVDLKTKWSAYACRAELLAALQTSQEKVAHLPVGKTHTEVIAALERVGVKLTKTVSRG